MSAQPPLDEATEVASQPANNTLKIVLITVLVIVLSAASAGGVWYFLSGKSHSASEKSAEGETEAAAEAEAPAEETEESENGDEKAAEPIFVTLEPFTVNLLPEGQFLQATFVLQIKNEKEAELIKVFMPQIRSRLLLMLSGKTADALSSQQGKTDLIKEIKQLISQPFKAGQKPVTVEEVHVTAFIIQ